MGQLHPIDFESGMSCTPSPIALGPLTKTWLGTQFKMITSSQRLPNMAAPHETLCPRFGPGFGMGMEEFDH